MAQRDKSKKMGGRVAKPMVGKRFGSLVVVKRHEKNDSSDKPLYECLCDCGKTSIVGGYHLRAGVTKSCGCQQMVNAIKTHTKLEGEASFNVIYAEYRSRARRKGYEFEFDKEGFREITSQNCYYCGGSPIQVQRSRQGKMNGLYVYNGIDRVDSTKGYTLDNTVPCCKVCNFMKMNMTEERFKEHLYKIIENYLSKE